MVNPQDIRWFSGFFEGEGSICFRQRKRRTVSGKQNYTGEWIYEPKISVHNNNSISIDLCSKFWALHFLNHYRGLDYRKLPKNNTHYLQITALDSILMFCENYKPYIQCDKVRLDAMLQFCSSRINRKSFSDYTDNELNCIQVVNQRRSSETTCEASYEYSKDWLAGIWESEGTNEFNPRTGNYGTSISNTNPSIIEKARFILRQDGIEPHIKDFWSPNDNRQNCQRLTLWGNTKFKRFCEYYLPYFRYRSNEFINLKI